MALGLLCKKWALVGKISGLVGVIKSLVGKNVGLVGNVTKYPL